MLFKWKISEQEDAKQLIQILRETARVALNVDLSKIPVGKFRTEKDVIKFFSNPINNVRYSPNKRFEILINFFREMIIIMIFILFMREV